MVMKDVLMIIVLFICEALLQVLKFAVQMPWISSWLAIGRDDLESLEEKGNRA